MSTAITQRLELDWGALGDVDRDDPDDLVIFASDDDAPFMVVYLKAGDWVRMGRPGAVAMSLTTDGQ